MDIKAATGFCAWAIEYIHTIINYILSWFSLILGALDMQWLWIGAVVFSILFSVILLPLRGGSMLGGGLMSDVARSRIRSRRNSNKHTED